MQSIGVRCVENLALALVSAMGAIVVVLLHFFFNDTATTEIYTLSLHDALPICRHQASFARYQSTVRRRPSSSVTDGRQPSSV